MLKFSYKRHDLIFKRPAGTSRGILNSKPTWFLELQMEKRCGRGEVSLIPGLSLDPEDGIEAELVRITSLFQQKKVQQQILDLLEQAEECHLLVDYQRRLADIALCLDRMEISSDGKFPAVRFAMEMVLLEFISGRKGVWFDSDFIMGRQAIPINGLIWMGDEAYMQEQIEAKLAEGYGCLKMKIGAIDFKTECSLLEGIRKNFSRDSLVLRVDANGAFSSSEAYDRLKTLSQFDLHSIEQPIKQQQWKEMAKLCAETPLDIALDEELIGIEEAVQVNLLESIKPQYIILKPSLLGGFHLAGKWLENAADKNISGWVTSALESNLGLNAIAQWVSLYNFSMEQGLGTGTLFTNNLESDLYIDRGYLKCAVGA